MFTYKNNPHGEIFTVRATKTLELTVCYITHTLRQLTIFSRAFNLIPQSSQAIHINANDHP